MSEFEAIEIQPCGPVDASIRPPGSKSITNRALVCAALAEGKSVLDGALDSEDTQVMIQGLRSLGLRVRHDADARQIVLSGCNRRLPPGNAEIYVANSGTTLRFLTAIVTLGHGVFRLDGTPRMRERPVADLLHALGALGADVLDELGTGCPPVCVRARGLPGGRAVVSGAISSQFLSALLMVAPCAQGPVELVVEGELVSKPYVLMTVDVMKAFGVEVAREGFERFLLDSSQHYAGANYAIEPDASAASYFLAAAAITGGRVTVEGLTQHAIQGDVAFCECLARMGCDVDYTDDSITVRGGRLHGIEADMNAISDTVQTLAAVAIFAEGPTTITHVGHIRHKETDRIAALAAELRKLGADVDEQPDGLVIRPGPLRGVAIDTYDDHRMAMSLALAGLRIPGVRVRNPGCTAKTYPDFFEDLRRVAGESPK
ncbi:MAG: 3-phosphoshikimate 1-carboxyvinyltransferase [Thermoguttaceae bacterium]|jgi:3-phosphoshikimate 1-carboxyvinyltransferase|nr:3-phosphoshikimate 1-carboxyvinyltransferase [Thermoguttaceae bacterium]